MTAIILRHIHLLAVLACALVVPCTLVQAQAVLSSDLKKEVQTTDSIQGAAQFECTHETAMETATALTSTSFAFIQKGVVAEPDSVRSDQTPPSDKPIVTRQGLPEKEPKSPSGALTRSLVCPGWGQLYNESYWKSALFFGAAATATGILLWNNAKFLNENTIYETKGISDVQKALAYSRREFYRDQRDVSGLWLLGIYALSAVDAYVGAHLFDFDVSDSGIGLLPVVSPGNVSFNASWRF